MPEQQLQMQLDSNASFFYRILDMNIYSQNSIWFMRLYEENLCLFDSAEINNNKLLDFIRRHKLQQQFYYLLYKEILLKDNKFMIKYAYRDLMDRPLTYIDHLLHSEVFLSKKTIKMIFDYCIDCGSFAAIIDRFYYFHGRYDVLYTLLLSRIKRVPLEIEDILLSYIQ
jgi:hypothetical protein